MLALWSRVTRTPGTCRCISCVSSATAVARRGRPRHLRGSWAFGGPTSTFLYTSIFAAGLAIDARAKAQRNKQWEEAFQHLKDALDDGRTGPESQQEQEVAQGNNAAHLANVDATDTHSPGSPKEQSLADAVLQSPFDNARDSFQQEQEQGLEWPANTGPELLRFNLAPQSLWALKSAQIDSKRRRYTRKKLSIQELSTGLLIVDLVDYGQIVRFSKSAQHELRTLSLHILNITSYESSKLEDVRLGLLRLIEAIESMQADDPQFADGRGYPRRPGIPRYQQDNDGDFHFICDEMNGGIKHLFKHCDLRIDRDKALTIAKICHNLLVSSASPNLGTFNVLLAGFSKWRADSLVDKVIACFLASKIRPNETTCQLILEHYTRLSRPNDFSLFVSRMRGLHGGLMLANPTISVNEASQGRLVKDEVIPERMYEKIYQKVYPTPVVFGPLIAGVLKFAGFDRALDIYYELKSDGWGLSVKELTKLLADCIRRADWEGGTYIWEEIRSVPQARHYDMVQAYHTMLSLCSVTGNTVAFNQVLNEVAKRGLDRRAILNAAMKTTRWAQHRKDYDTPAWMADNLMIAVSDYVSDSKIPEEEDDGLLPNGTALDTDALSDQEARQSRNNDEKPVITDRKEAWATWVEHEFGERPKDPEL